MNIFKTLSNGHGKISETNITSFLSYVLNQTSEVKQYFATLLILELNKKLNNWIFTYLDIEFNSTR